MLLRLWLRYFLLWILVWAASDVFIVWYWTGRISGPGAHEYFGRWILAWFFTQKLPLYFLTLPFKGGRATIDSMYAYLNWSFDLNRDFGVWFAAYSLWGGVLPTLIVVAIGFVLVRDPVDRPEGRHLRGLTLIPPRRLSRELRRAGLRSDRPGVELARVELSAALDRLNHIDHAYASTSHSAQGATVDRVIVDIDTRLSPELVNRKQFYVSISRARNALAIYTNDRAQLPRTASRSREKSMAIQHSTPAPRHSFTIVPDGNLQSFSRGHGIRR